MALRSAMCRATCSTLLSSSMTLTGSQISIRQFGHSLTLSSSDRKTNQQERAIRVKNQERARIRRKERDGDESALEQRSSRRSTFGRQSGPTSFGHSLEKQRKSRDSELSVREKRYRVAIQLMDLFYKKVSALEAFKEAEELVNSMSNYNRRSTYIYNAYIRHAVRAGKGKGALSIFQDMKKNGVAPNIDTFRSLFTGIASLPIQADQNKNLIEKITNTFEELKTFWLDAIRYKEGKINTEVFGASEGRVASKEHEKQEVLHTNTTPIAFQTSRIKAYSDSLKTLNHLYQAVNEYLNFLLAAGMEEEAAELVINSTQFNKPFWSKNGTQYAPALTMTLSKTFLEYQQSGRSEAGTKKNSPLFSKAIEFSQSVIKDEKSVKAYRSMENDRLSRRWQRMQDKGKMSLALTKEEMKEMFDEEEGGSESAKSSLSKSL